MQIKQRTVDYYKTPAGKMPAQEYLLSLKDKLTQAMLFKRIRQAGQGQFGKIRNVGGGVWELKIDHGPGYRVYYGIHGNELVLILMAGSKRTQDGDIKKARVYWIEWKERNI